LSFYITSNSFFSLTIESPGRDILTKYFGGKKGAKVNGEMQTKEKFRAFAQYQRRDKSKRRKSQKNSNLV